MPTVEDSGTITTSASEQTLTSITANKTLMLWLDLVNLQAGDTVVVRCKRTVLSGGTARTIITQTYSGVQDPPVVCSPPFTAPHGATFTIQRTAGSDRSIPWSVESS